MITVPQIKGLMIQDILKEAKAHVDIDKYMPNLAKGKQPDRDFVCNVGTHQHFVMIDIVNTLMPSKLRDRIEKWMVTRESKYIKKNNLNMKVLLEFKELFEAVPSLSSKSEYYHEIGTAGRFHQLVKNVGQRRDRMYYEEVTKEERKDISERLDSKDKKIESLLSKIKDFEEKIADQEKNSELLARLYDSGIIDEDGWPVIRNDDQNDMK